MKGEIAHQGLPGFEPQLTPPGVVATLHLLSPSLCFLESSPSLCARGLTLWEQDSWQVGWGQLIAGCLLPPNNKMLCSLVEDYTRREVFAKPTAVLKQNSEEDGELASQKEEGKPAFVSLAGSFSLTPPVFKAIGLNYIYSIPTQPVEKDWHVQRAQGPVPDTDFS